MSVKLAVSVSTDAGISVIGFAYDLRISNHKNERSEMQPSLVRCIREEVSAFSFLSRNVFIMKKGRVMYSVLKLIQSMI